MPSIAFSWRQRLGDKRTGGIYFPSRRVLRRIAFALCQNGKRHERRSGPPVHVHLISLNIISKRREMTVLYPAFSHVTRFILAITSPLYMARLEGEDLNLWKAVFQGHKVGY